MFQHKVEVIKASTVQQIIDNAFDQEKWEEIVGRINGQLQDTKFLTDWRCGTKEDGYYYRFSGEGELSKAMVLQLEKDFNEAGWKKVEIINNGSSESERACYCIILTLPPVA